MQGEQFSSAVPGIVKTTITRNKVSSHRGLKGCIFFIVGKIEAKLIRFPRCFVVGFIFVNLD